MFRRERRDGRPDSEAGKHSRMCPTCVGDRGAATTGRATVSPRADACGPATIPPTELRSPRHRRDLLKIAYHRLGRLARVRVAELVASNTDRLLSIAAGLEPVKGQQGKARRLVMKIVRLSA